MSPAVWFTAERAPEGVTTTSAIALPIPWSASRVISTAVRLPVPPIISPDTERRVRSLSKEMLRVLMSMSPSEVKTTLPSMPAPVRLVAPSKRMPPVLMVEPTFMPATTTWVAPPTVRVPVVEMVRSSAWLNPKPPPPAPTLIATVGS